MQFAKNFMPALRLWMAQLYLLRITIALSVKH
jgi:hypothetical protein